MTACDPRKAHKFGLGSVEVLEFVAADPRPTATMNPLLARTSQARVENVPQRIAKHVQ